MRLFARALPAALLVVPIGTACLFAPRPAPCRTDVNCPDDLACVDGACGVREDAGVVDDGGVDDGGAPVDAGDGCLVLDTLVVDDSDAADAVADEACVRVTGDLVVQGDFFARGIEGLAPVVEVGGDLRVQSTNALVSLDGLQAVERVGGDLVIATNQLLSDVLAVHGLRVEGNATVRDNSVLGTCEAEELVASLDLGGTAVVQGNLFDGCGS